MGLIYLDACLLIYVVESDPVFGEPMQALFAKRGSSQLAVSSLTRMECLVKPMARADHALQQRYALALNELVQLPMPDQVFEQATRLRAQFGLRTPDALHLACALVHGCDELWTNDDRMVRAGQGLALNVLGQLGRRGTARKTVVARSTKRPPASR